LVEVFKRICPALVPDGKRKTLIVRLGTVMVVPVALGGGLYWYYHQRGHTDKMKAYYKKLETIYDYDYEEDDEPTWSSSSWVMLFCSICLVMAYAFRSFIFKSQNGPASPYGTHGGIGEGLRQWAPQAGVPPPPAAPAQQQQQSPPPPPQAMHQAGDAYNPRGAGPAPPGLRLGQEPPNIMNQEFHQRRLGALNAMANNMRPPSSPSMGPRMRYQPSSYMPGQGEY
jgi:hypothetical protein